MKIIYNENPLNTVIELDESETEVLWHKVKIDKMKWLLFGAHFHLVDEGDRFNLDRARHEVDPDYYLPEPTDRKGKTKLDKWVDESMVELMNALNGAHCGNCCCVPSSCDKCEAEDLLGINTTKGLKQQQASKIFAAFGESRENNWTSQRSIDEAIEHLENYEPKADWDGWEAEVPRWKEEAAGAAEWLKIYRNQHFVDPKGKSRDN